MSMSVSKNKTAIIFEENLKKTINIELFGAPSLRDRVLKVILFQLSIPI